MQQEQLCILYYLNTAGVIITYYAAQQLCILCYLNTAGFMLTYYAAGTGFMKHNVSRYSMFHNNLSIQCLSQN